MQIQLSDSLAIDAQSVRRTRDGYLAANARAARTGIQLYRARELGLTDRDPSAVVRVYRPADEVFAADALASLAYRPMTNDHPAEEVTASNWRDHSIGMAGGEIARDGDFVRVPLLMMDAAAISDFQDGKRELSVGYSCRLEMVDGVTADGQAYDAVQHDIRANHIALCHTARGGDKLTFGDGQGAKTPTTQETPNVTTRTIAVDGISVTVDDNAAAIIARLQTQAADAQRATGEAQAQIATLTADSATKDGTIAALNQQLADARNPATLAAAAAARASLIGAAKKLLGDAYTGDGLDDAAIRRAAVASKMADAADPAKMSDEAVAGAFGVLTAGVAAPLAAPRDSLALAVQQHGAAIVDQGDPKALRDAAFAKRAADKAGAHLAAVSE